MRHEKMTAWAATEDEAILEMVVRHGPRWSKIAIDLPGRSVASIRNRYLRIQKGGKKRSEGGGKNRCHACARRSKSPATPCPNRAASHLQLRVRRRRAAEAWARLPREGR